MLLAALPQIFAGHIGAATRRPQGVVFTVNTTNDHDDGTCNGADCTLREAIQAANSAATEDKIGINVTGTIDLLSVLPDITDSVTIEGPGAELLTIQRAATTGFRIFTVTATGPVTLSGMTVTKGRVGAGSGAGVFNDSGTLNILDTIVTDNVATDSSGGGIINISGTVNITGSIIKNNSTDSKGGGVYNFEGKVNIANSTISDNRADDTGGGIYNASTMTISGSTITDNVASDKDGGGVINSGLLNIINSTISTNLASDGSGGGIANSPGGTVNLTNSTVSSNRARLAGGGVLNRDGGAFQVRSTIIALNSADFSGPDARGSFISTGFNLIGQIDNSAGFTQSTDLTGTIASPRDPGLDPNGPQNNGGPTKTIALLCGSPAIDKGTNDGLTGNLFIDQRGEGFPRTIDDPLISNASNGTDIGAFELPVCNHPPVAQCRNVQVSANNSCQATITAAQIDNGSFDPDPADSIVSRTLDNSGPFGLGPHTVTLTVTDSHNAPSTCTSTVTVVDTTPPMISCPANIVTKSTNVGNSTVVVNYPGPTAVDNCSTPSVICSPPSGSQFPRGTTTVTCTAKDAANNSASCSFSLVVFDVCLQDDSTRDTLFFDSQTGAYAFFRCGAAGFTMSGTGGVLIRGGIITLEHNAGDRKLVAKLDNTLKKGTASLQVLITGKTYTIADRNTDDNSCSCL